MVEPVLRRASHWLVDASGISAESTKISASLVETHRSMGKLAVPLYLPPGDVSSYSTDASHELDTSFTVMLRMRPLPMLIWEYLPILDFVSESSPPASHVGSSEHISAPLLTDEPYSSTRSRFTEPENGDVPSFLILTYPRMGSPRNARRLPSSPATSKPAPWTMRDTPDPTPHSAGSIS